MTIRSARLLALAVAALLAGCGSPTTGTPLAASRSARLTVAPGNDTLVTGLGGAAGYGAIDLTATTSAAAPVTAFAGDLDDGVWTIDLSSLFPDGILFAGRKYQPATVYVGTNGYLTFGQAVQLWSLDAIAHAPAPLVAAFLADADLRTSGKVYLDAGDASAADPTVTLTWVGVPPFGGGSGTNAFQLRLHRVSTDATAGDKVAVELRYGQLGWTTTDSMAGLQGVGGWSDWNATTGFVAANLFPRKTYDTIQVTDSDALTWGTSFTSSIAGKVLGLRYYADPAQGGTVTAALFGGDTAPVPSVLAQKTASASGVAGWSVVLFDTPVDVVSGTTYTTALFTPSPVSVRAIRDYFDGAVDSGPLHMPTNAGTFAYGSGLTFPNATYLSSSYLIDAIFQAGSANAAFGEILSSGTAAVSENATANASATNLVPAQPGVYVFGAAGVPGAISTAGSASPQSATVSTAFAQPLAVTVADPYGTPLSGVTVTFAAPGSGASAALSATTATTDAQGVASVTATANGAAGAYAVTATAGSLTASFQLTNAAAGSGSGGSSSGGSSGSGGSGGGDSGSGSSGSGSRSSGGGCGTGGDATAGLLLPALSALALRLRRRR